MLNEIVQKFFPNETVLELKPFGHGHINDTYKLVLENHTNEYILQRINTTVFKNPQGIIQTHLKLQEVFENENHSVCIAKVFPTTSGEFLYMDAEKMAWRLTNFIPESYTVSVVEEAWQAFQGGSAYGWFAKVCNQLNAGEFVEAIPDFHKLSFRMKQLHEAIADDKAGRVKLISEVLKFVADREPLLNEIENLVNAGEIPIRVVHNDTKINNLLFRGNQAAAVIDLDTTGPGILFYDYGDALRTGANTAVEDEKDLTKVKFNIEAFKACTEGYLGQVKPILSAKENDLFYQAPILMTFIIGSRFLTDYLNGDVYYKTAYDDHNLVRAKVQFKLIESMESQQETMKKIIADALN